jgi:hypothetical protein
MNEDFPVRAALDDWDSAMRYWNMTHLAISRGLDEVLFADCGKVERLAVLRLVHLRLRFLEHQPLNPRVNLTVVL